MTSEGAGFLPGGGPAVSGERRASADRGARGPGSRPQRSGGGAGGQEGGAGAGGRDVAVVVVAHLSVGGEAGGVAEQVGEVEAVEADAAVQLLLQHLGGGRAEGQVDGAAGAQQRLQQADA